MVVANLDARLVKTVEHSLVDGNQHLILPQVAVGGGVQTHGVSHALNQVVALGVTKIARGNFCSHVPAIERCAWVSDAANDQGHFTDDGYGIPTETQGIYTGILRVGDVHFRELLGVRSEMIDGWGLQIIDPDGPWQRCVGGSSVWDPPLLKHTLGKIEGVRVALNAAICLFKPRIPEQLVVGDSDRVGLIDAVGVSGRKNRDDTLNGPSLPRQIQVVFQGVYNP